MLSPISCVHVPTSVPFIRHARIGGQLPVYETVCLEMKRSQHRQRADKFLPARLGT